MAGIRQATPITPREVKKALKTGILSAREEAGVTYDIIAALAEAKGELLYTP